MGSKPDYIPRHASSDRFCGSGQILSGALVLRFSDQFGKKGLDSKVGAERLHSHSHWTSVGKRAVLLWLVFGNL